MGAQSTFGKEIGIMRFLAIPLEHLNLGYHLDPITGSLLVRKPGLGQPNLSFPNKLNQALQQCKQPYLLSPSIVQGQLSNINASGSCGRRFGRLLIALSRWNFWFAYRVASLGRARFEDAREASVAFRRNNPRTGEDGLCLPRSLFAAGASRKFKKTGVIFIGVFLPSRSMHAWIIEDGIQPDPYDSLWLNFQPFAALC
jgi:hypothetical protein